MRLFFFGPRLFGIRPGVSFGPEDFRTLRRPTVADRQRPSPEALGGSFVYVIRGDHHRCKIGISSNPNARLAQLRTASAFPLSFAFVGVTDRTDGSAIEREAHTLLDRYRVAGEWFDCPVELAIAAVNGAAARLGEKLCAIDPGRVDDVIRLALANNPAESAPDRLAAFGGRVLYFLFCAAFGLVLGGGAVVVIFVAVQLVKGAN